MPRPSVFFLLSPAVVVTSGPCLLEDSLPTSHPPQAKSWIQSALLKSTQIVEVMFSRAEACDGGHRAP